MQIEHKHLAEWITNSIEGVTCFSYSGDQYGARDRVAVYPEKSSLSCKDVLQRLRSVEGWDFEIGWGGGFVIGLKK